jgi:hypothetical protein
MDLEISHRRKNGNYKFMKIKQHGFKYNQWVIEIPQEKLGNS